MDQLEEESFLDELMSLRQEDAPSPWEANPGGNLLFYASESAAQARSGPMDVAPFGDLLAPMPTAAPLHRPHEEFNFDYLSEVCNPYRSCAGDRVPAGVVHAADQALGQYPLHHAMTERETSGGKLHRGGGLSSSPALFKFGAGGRGTGESSGTTISMIRGRGVVSGTHTSMPSGGAPSKNLMAERRRRKRLNDRLSMLRSIVPKISKVCRIRIVL